MENENLNEIKNEIEEIKDAKYKEIKINKMIVNGKEQAGNIISAEDTKDMQELNITVYTQDIGTVQKKEKRSKIYELLPKGIFRNRRS
jgi:hypothetical protein